MARRAPAPLEGALFPSFSIQIPLWAPFYSFSGFYLAKSLRTSFMFFFLYQFLFSIVLGALFAIAFLCLIIVDIYSYRWFVFVFVVLVRALVFFFSSYCWYRSFRSRGTLFFIDLLFSHLIVRLIYFSIVWLRSLLLFLNIIIITTSCIVELGDWGLWPLVS